MLLVPDNHASFLRPTLLEMSRFWGAPGLRYQSLSLLRTGEAFLPPKLLQIREGSISILLHLPLGRIYDLLQMRGVAEDPLVADITLGNFT